MSRPKKPRTLSEALEIKDYEISPYETDRLYYRENRKGSVELSTERKPYALDSVPAKIEHRIIARLVFRDGREIENVPLAYYRGHPLVLGPRGKYQLKHRHHIDPTGLKHIDITFKRTRYDSGFEED